MAKKNRRPIESVAEELVPFDFFPVGEPRVIGTGPQALRMWTFKVGDDGSGFGIVEPPGGFERLPDGRFRTWMKRVSP